MTGRIHAASHALILVSRLTSLMACAPENNPTTMKGRTITPARLPKVQPMTLPKVPASVREQLTGTTGRRHPSTPATRNATINPRRPAMTGLHRIMSITTTLLLLMPLTAWADSRCESYYDQAWRAYEKAHQDSQNAYVGIPNERWRYAAPKAIDLAKLADRYANEATRYAKQSEQYAKAAHQHANQVRQICNKAPYSYDITDPEQERQVQQIRDQARNAAENAETAAKNAEIMEDNASNASSEASWNYGQARSEEFLFQSKR